MAGIALQEASFAGLLPESIRHDERIAAAARGVDRALAMGDANREKVLIWSRIDQLEEPLLTNLAYQMHLEGYEGWHLAETLQQKRNLIKNAYILHWHKGTRYGLERIFGILDMRGLITEWWESDEPPEDFPPYTFDIDIEATRAIDGQFYDDVWNLIEALKNLRSQLRRARIILITRGKVPKVAAVLFGGVTMTLYPFISRGGEVRSETPRIAGTLQNGTVATIYPFGESA